MARRLQHDGIPVLLAVQVDSVSKFRENDKVISSNVAQAVNLYQPNGIRRGEPIIHAADSKRTHIIGNFRFDHRSSPYNCGAYPWYDRVLTKPHMQIECDPKVWNQVESLIRSNLPAK